MSDKKRTVDDGQSRELAGSLVTNTAMFALSHGVSMGEILAATGCSQEELSAFDARLPEEALPAIWNLLLERDATRAWPLELSAVVSHMFLGVLSYSAQFARTFGEFLELFGRFHKLLSPRLSLEIVQEGEEVSMRFSHPMDALDRHASAQSALALGVRLSREVTGEDCLRAVHFSSPSIGPLAEYESYFGVPVCVCAPTNALVFRASAMRLPCKESDPSSFRSMQMHLERVHTQLMASDPLQDVRDAIEANAREGEFGAEGLAKRMKVSLRVLQRRVSAQGSTVKQMLEAVREGHARVLLEDDALTVEQVAYRLGYSEGRAFRRFFKRMTGLTPAQFRKEEAGWRDEPA